MYFEFMKNFLFVDSGEQMPVKLISASWAQKRVIPLSRDDVREVHEKYSSRRFRLADACKTHFDLQSKKTFDSYFLEMMYVEFMKNFFSPISASRCLLDSFRPPEPKTFDSYFLDMMYVEFMKNFLLADSGEQMPVRLISASWAQKRLIPTF